MLLYDVWFSIETSMTELKPAVLEKLEFEHSDEWFSVALLRIFGSFWFWCEYQELKLFINYSFTKLRLSDETLIEEIKAAISGKLECENRNKIWNIRFFGNLAHQELDTWLKTNGFPMNPSLRMWSFQFMSWWKNLVRKKCLTIEIYQKMIALIGKYRQSRFWFKAQTTTAFSKEYWGIFSSFPIET